MLRPDMHATCIHAYTHTCEQIDSDDSGMVSVKELKATLEEGRWIREQEELEAELEQDDSLLRARDELKQGLMGTLSQIAEIFKASDVDSSGMVDAAEFSRAVAALGLTASRETCDAVFSHYDVTPLSQRKHMAKYHPATITPPPSHIPALCTGPVW